LTKTKHPKTIFVTYETGSDEPYRLVHETANMALEDSDGNDVAEYALVQVRKGKLVPVWEDK